MDEPRSYRVSRLSRKRGPHLVDRLAREAAVGEAPNELRRRRLPLEQAGGTDAFGLQSGNGIGGRIVRDQTPAKVRADGGVAVPPPLEPLRAALRDPCVVE